MIGTDTRICPDLSQLLWLEHETTVKGETTKTVTYAITSRSVKVVHARAVARSVA